jgi:uncharacterized protein involved in exopolysaccharide biosynthesis
MVEHPGRPGSIDKDSDERVHLGEYVRIVWKRKWMILVPTAIVLLTAWIGLRFVTPTYESKALIEIIDQDVIESVADEFADQGRRGGRRDRPSDYEEERVRQLNQQVTGQRFLGPVGKRLGLDRNPEILAAAQNMQSRLPDLKLDDLVVYAYTARLKEKIEVEKSGISLYEFICKDEDPHLAYALARAVAEEYLSYVLAEGIEVVDRTQEFSGEQLERYQRLLVKAEDALEAKQRQLQGRALNIQSPVTDENFTDAKRLLDEADLEITSLEGRVTRGLDRIPPMLRREGAIESKINSGRLASLSGMLRQAEVNQLPISIQGGAAGGVVAAEVSQTRQELFAEIQEQVARAFPTETLATQNLIRDIVFDRRTLASVRARRDRIQQLLGSYSARVVQAPEDDIELRRLQDEVERYRGLVANIEERRITDDLRKYAQEASASARVKIVQQPEVPTKPSSPDRGRILLLALCAGPLLGIGAVIIAETVDTSFRSVEEVEEELGLSVLGTIPRLFDSTLQAKRKRTRGGIERAGVAG